MVITVADKSHEDYAETICKMMEDAAKIRGTGIAKRKPEYVKKKMEEGKSVIAIDKGEVVGFCYIESWEGQKFVANSGLIVHPDYRNTGLAKKIKTRIFELSKEKFPNAKLFGITTSLAVMKINSDLGYKPVTFSELTTDETFWDGCKSCTNHDILMRTERKMCLCTGMVCDLSKIAVDKKVSKSDRWDSFKQFMKERIKRFQQKAKQEPKLNEYKDLIDGK
ncbi:MAG: GNAT family N-acetyltransferase [Vicingus serpentipes]|nr:GNAT family N-acetyltransferase [Vicingus serpentipes]